MEFFHSIIFGLHLAAALIITCGIWLRCDPDIWVSHMRVDTYTLPVNSTGLWWGVSEDLTAECAAMTWNSSLGMAVAKKEQSIYCFREDMPLYEREPANLGWHLFALLGHFEWISASFAFFYIKGSWNRHSWWISILMAGVGTVFFFPWRGAVFVNEVILLLVNFAVCIAAFYGYRGVHGYPGHRPPTQQDALPPPPSSRAPSPPPVDIEATQHSRYNTMRVPPMMILGGKGSMETDSLRLAELPAMRYIEYCITAAELWVAVLSIFVSDAPAFMTIGGYTLILLCNLYGLLLHYSLVSYNMTTRLSGHAAVIPDQINMTGKRRQRRRTLMRVPAEWLSAGDEPAQATPQDNGLNYHAVQNHVWGSFIASNISTLFNSWLAYIVAVGIIFYQQTFLFSSNPPFFVVFAGWSLLVFYTSFGVWITVIYYFPDMCRCCPTWILPAETYELTTLGLDILSVGAKLSVVGSLSFGFVFEAGGRC